MAVAEEKDDEYSINMWRGGWSGPDLNYPDPEHPLAFVREPAKEYYARASLERAREVIKQHGKTLKEVAEAGHIDPRTLNNKLEHPESLTATEVKALCEFIGCKLDELRYAHNDEDRAFDWYMSLNDYHREVARNVIWSLKQAENNVHSLICHINEMEDETGDVSRFIKWHDERMARSVDELVAEWNAEHSGDATNDEK